MNLRLDLLIICRPGNPKENKLLDTINWGTVIVAGVSSALGLYLAT